MPSALAIQLARPICSWCGLTMRYRHASNRWECNHRGGARPPGGKAPLLEIVSGEDIAQRRRT